MDGSDIVAVSSASFTAICIGLMRWSLSRNVNDIDSKVSGAASAARAAHDAVAVADRESRDRDAAIERRIGEEGQLRALLSSELSKDVKHITNSLAEFSALQKELQRLFETTRDKQAEHYRKELKETENKLHTQAEQLRLQVNELLLTLPRSSRPRK